MTAGALTPRDQLIRSLTRPDVPFSPGKHALAVLRKRYLARDGQGRIVEEPADLLWRVATRVAAAEGAWAEGAQVEGRVRDAAEEFHAAMARLEFVPNSPVLMNAGRRLGQCFACFVLPVADALTQEDGEGIFDVVRIAALIHQSGGGTGFSFSRLRPEGARVSTTHGRTSGPISFMRVFNAATEAIHQGGFRRGANMGILRVDHPDILDFVRLKTDPREMVNFNLSVGLTDAFALAFREDRVHEVVDPATGGRAPLRAKTRDALGALSGHGERAWTARDLLDEIARAAWATGEPGVVLLDRVNRDNPTPSLGPIEATNPCGEQPLLPWEACTLGSVNLSRFFADGEIHWTRLAETVRVAVRFLDDVIDINRHPTPQTERIVRGNRKIGLGVMGWADLLFRLDVRYDSDRALELARAVMKFVREEAWKASMELAVERGPFPNFERSLFVEAPLEHPYFPDAWRAACRAEGRRVPMRNAAVTTIAPTGTLSILAGTTGGIEPLFSPAFRRQILDGGTFLEVHPFFRETAQREGFWSDGLVDRILEEGSIRGIAGIPERVRDLFVCAHDIEPEAHLRMQAAFQEHTDNAVSKTVNFPKDARPEDVRRAYLLAMDLGLKGVTVYRDGCRKGQPMALAASGEDEGRCPECGAPLPYAGGCAIETCSCGYSRCS
ncbi:MAG: adenosylcobalamin-dependent ribonucleoside-diphosphate reductase [Planctomycetota bacterium]|jgi:ribonucleoside-diphosphate reductase alpha chain